MASVMIIDRASGKMIWAGEAGDRSLWLGPLSRGGPRKVAQRIADGIKKAIVAVAGRLPPPPPLSDAELAHLAQSKAAKTGPEDIPTANAPPPVSKPMTNDDVVTLVATGLSDDLIVAKMKASTTRFRMDTDDIVLLKKNGVSDRVIAAMIEAASK